MQIQLSTYVSHPVQQDPLPMPRGDIAVAPTGAVDVAGESRLATADHPGGVVAVAGRLRRSRLLECSQRGVGAAPGAGDMLKAITALIAREAGLADDAKRAA